MTPYNDCELTFVSVKTTNVMTSPLDVKEQPTFAKVNEVKAVETEIKITNAING
jgi:hypothetical protein